MVPPHPYQAALDILDQLRAEGRTIRRPSAPPQETPTHPRIEQFQRRLEAAERARQAPPQPSPIEQIRQRLEARTQPVQPTERQLEVLPGPYQVIRSTRGEGWEVVNTDTQELVTQAPVANYFEAEEQAMRLNEALPEPTRQLQGGYLPGQRVRDRRGRVLTVIDNAGPNLLMAQAADGSRVRVHLRAIEPVDEPIRPPVDPDVIEVEAEPVEATPPPAPTPPAQQVAPPSPPAEPVPPPTPPAEEAAPPTPRRIERAGDRLYDVQPGEVVLDPRDHPHTVQ